jgi:hypothetical protein
VPSTSAVTVTPTEDEFCSTASDYEGDYFAQENKPESPRTLNDFANMRFSEDIGSSAVNNSSSFYTSIDDAKDNPERFDSGRASIYCS